MQSSPLVSVIIPTFNRANLLDQAIRSVLGQSYSNSEIIVVDDGSTDHTPEIVRSYSGRVHYIRMEHIGRAGPVRNRGLAASSGSLIAFLDHDDIWLSDKLTRQVAMFDADPGLGLVYTDACFLYPDGSISQPGLREHQKDGDQFFDQLLQQGFVKTSTVMVRKRLFDELGAFDERFVSQEDYHFFLRVGIRSRVGCIPDPLVYIRILPGTFSTADRILQYQDLAQVILAIRDSEVLNWQRRLLSRRTLARLYVHVGIDHQMNRRIAEARRSLFLSIRWNPLQKRAWRELVK